MLSNKQKKLINKLRQKKYRSEYRKFIVEGEKITGELSRSGYRADAVFALPSSSVDATLFSDDTAFHEVNEKELAAISGLKAPNKVLAVVDMPDHLLPSEKLQQELFLVLDRINDPGNLGTVVRIADWFGINHIICSDGSVDAYNPKAVQSAMGSLFRVKVHYHNLPALLEECKERKVPVYGAAVEGDDIYSMQLPAHGAVMMGSESHGLQKELTSFADRLMAIPSFGGAESLNIASATAIICSEFRRRG